MSLAQDISEAVEKLTVEDQRLILELAKRLKIEDTSLDEEISDIERAKEKYEKGETIEHNRLNWD